MADENQDLDQTPEFTDKPPGGGNPIVTILLIVNAIAMGAIAYLQFESHKKQEQQETIMDTLRAQLEEQAGTASDEEGRSAEDALGERTEEEGILLPLDAFTANLAQGDGPRRFVRLNAVLKFSKDSKEEEFKARKPQIRDVVISILNSKRPEDLLKKEGKTYLKEEIKQAINAFLVNGHVIDMYYVGFQIN